MHSDGQRNAPRNLSKHGQSSHQSKGGANTTQPTAATSVVQQGAKSDKKDKGAPTQKHQKHVDHSVSSSHQSNNSLQSSNGQQHQQKHVTQPSPFFREAKQASGPACSALYGFCAAKPYKPALQRLPRQRQGAAVKRNPIRRKIKATTESFFFPLAYFQQTLLPVLKKPRRQSQSRCRTSSKL